MAADRQPGPLSADPAIALIWSEVEEIACGAADDDMASLGQAIGLLRTEAARVDGELDVLRGQVADALEWVLVADRRAPHTMWTARDAIAALRSKDAGGGEAAAAPEEGTADFANGSDDPEPASPGYTREAAYAASQAVSERWDEILADPDHPPSLAAVVALDAAAQIARGERGEERAVPPTSSQRRPAPSGPGSVSPEGPRLSHEDHVALGMPFPPPPAVVSDSPTDPSRACGEMFTFTTGAMPCNKPKGHDGTHGHNADRPCLAGCPYHLPRAAGSEPSEDHECAACTPPPAPSSGEDRDDDQRVREALQSARAGVRNVLQRHGVLTEDDSAQHVEGMVNAALHEMRRQNATALEALRGERDLAHRQLDRVLVSIALEASNFEDNADVLYRGNHVATFLRAIESEGRAASSGASPEGQAE